MYRNLLRDIAVILPSIAITLAPHIAYAADPVPAAPGPPQASSFPGPDWSTLAPVGGTTSASNSHLFLNVPGGANHDVIIPSNQAVRAVQPIGNVNFDVSIKIDSTVVATNANTAEGLMVTSNATNYFTFGLMTDGTRIHLTVQTVVAGVATKVFDNPNFSEYQNPMYLRLTRTGNTYVGLYSIDGSTWQQASSFSIYKAPAFIGPFASNYNPTPANAVPVVMAVNWFNVE
jgi:hypothetical protein